MFLMKISVTLLLLASIGMLGSRCWAHDDADDLNNHELHLDRNALQIDGQDSMEFPRNEPKMKRTIAIVGDSFVLDGTKGLHLLSGSLHYFRTPAVYWRDILSKLKAAGLNAVSTYVEWSFHEAEEREYDFSGDRDVAQFIRTAAEVGLYVLLRPGPYICAERDLGGLPYWLLGKYPDIKLRSTDPNFLNESGIWFEKLFSQVAPLLYGNGGPIILVQVENEYGSYSNDKKYMGHIRDLLLEEVQGNALLYTTDGSYPQMFRDGSIDGALTTIDFGSGADVTNLFANLRAFMPTGPLMNSEYYPGWLTHWTEQMQHVDSTQVVDTFKLMLRQGVHVNFYVFFGGTNFEFTSGANYDESRGLYQPDITSYDYDAPITEAGDLTHKYFAIRKALEQHFPDLKEFPIPPSITAKSCYGTVQMVPRIEMLSSQGRDQMGTTKTIHRNGSELPSFEMLRQRAGFVLYEITITAKNIPKNTYKLFIEKPRDRVYVFVDGKFTGLIGRAEKKHHNIFSAEEQFTMSLLVENQGRINYGSQIHDFKGALGKVTLNNHSIVPGDWTITGFKLEQLNVTYEGVLGQYSRSSYLMAGPVLYDGQFSLPTNEEPKHTYLNTDGWGKGYIWINGHNLGRYWPSAGPQITLFVPGTWLNAAPQSNHIQLLELEEPSPKLTVELIDHPIFKTKDNQVKKGETRQIFL